MGSKINGITGSGGVNDAPLRELLNIALQMKSTLETVNKTKYEVNVDGGRLSDINNELNNLEDNVKRQSKTKTELFNTKVIQDNISRITSSMDGLFSKISIDGQKLTDAETREFIRGYHTLRKYSDEFGIDLRDKYKQIYIDMVETVKNGSFDVAHTLQFDPAEFKKVFKQISNEILNENGFFQKSLLDAEKEATDTIINQRRITLKEEKQQLQNEQKSFTEAQRQKRDETKRVLQETVNMMKEYANQMLDTIPENHVFNVNDEDIIKFQTLFGQVIDMMHQFGMDTIEVEEIMERISLKTYIPESDMRQYNAKKIDEYKQKIIELEETLNSLKLKYEQLLDQMDYMYTWGEVQDKLHEATNAHVQDMTEYTEAINYLKQTIEELETRIKDLKEENDALNNDLSYSVNMFDWNNKCEEVERLEKKVNELEETIERLNKYDSNHNDTLNNISSEFDNDQMVSFVNLLSEIEKHLKDIQKTLGSVDDDSFVNVIGNLNTVLEKLDEIHSKVGTGVYNIDIHQGVDKNALKSNEAVKEYTRKTATRYQNAYDKIVERAGGEELLFSYINNIINPQGGVTELINSYSSINVGRLKTSEEKIYRMISFFKLLRQAATDENFGLDISGITLPAGSDETFRQKIRELSGLKKEKNVDNLLNLNDDKINLNDILETLKEIKDVIETISNKDYFGDIFDKLISKLDSILDKFKEIVRDELVEQSRELLRTQQAETEAERENIDVIKQQEQAQQELADSKKNISQQSIETTNLFTDGCAKQSGESIVYESDALEVLDENAEDATESKTKFAKANADVLQSIVESVKGLGDEAETFKSLNKLINNLANNKDDRIQKIADNIRVLRDALNEPVAENSLMMALKELASQGENLKDLANVLKASKKQINNAKNKVKTIDEDKFYENVNVQKSKVDNLLSKREYVEDFREQLEEVQSGLQELRDNPASEEAIKKLREFSNQISDFSKKATLAENKAAKSKSVQKYLMQINEILSKNTSAKFKRTDIYEDLVRLQNELKNFDTSRAQSELDELGDETLKAIARFKELDQSTRGTGFLGRITNRLSDMNAKFIAQYLSFHDLIQYARTAITTIIDLDTQLVDLRKTTKMNDTELEEFYKNSSNVAKQLGVTTSEIISQASAWSRLGYNTKEASTQMAELSSQFASISPGLDTETATDDLVSTMKAFGIATENVERQVMDNINAIGNSMATTNAEIGEMLKRSSAAMKAGNNSLEQTIALESAAVQITRNAETTGTAFRTISMRIRGYSEESEDGLEEVDEELKNISGDIADLTKINGKGGISIFTDESRSEYKSTYQILKEISEIWADLTDAQQAGLLEKLAGKRGGQVLAGILNDFSSVEEALKTMDEAAGSSDREMSIIRDSLEFKINSLKQTWVQTLTELTDRGQIGDIIDFLTNVSEGISDIVSNLGLVKTALIGVFSVIGSRKLDLFDFSQSGGIGRNGLGGMLRELFDPLDETTIADADGLKELIKYLKNGNKTLDDVFNTDKLDDTLSNFSEETADKILEIGTASNESAKQVSGLQNLLGNTSKLKAFGSAALNVGKSLLSTFANAAISGGITWLVSTLGGALITAISNFIHRVENAKKAIDDSITSYETAKTDLENLNKELETTQTRMNDLLSKDSLTLVEQDELEKLKETNDELERQIRIKEREVQLSQRDTLDTIVANYRTATQDTRNTLKDGYQVTTTALRESDGTIFSNTFSVDTAEEYEEKLREIEDDYEDIQNILGGREFRSVQYDELTDDRFTIAGATKEELDRIKEEFGSIERFKSYYEVLGSNLESMREASKSIAYDLGSDLLKYEQWIDQMDEIGYVNLNFDQKQAYDSLKELVADIQNSIYNDSELFTIKIKAQIQDTDLQNNIKAIHTGLLNSGLLDNISEEETKQIEDWLLGLSEEEAQAIADSMDQILPNLIYSLFGRLNPDLLKDVVAKYRKEIDAGFTVVDPTYGADGSNFTIVKIFEYLVNEAKNAKAEIKDVVDETKKLQHVLDETNAVDSMDKMKTAFASLGDLYDQVINKPENADENFLFGFADPATLNSVESAFKDFIETIDDKETKEKLSYVLRDFETTLLEFPGDADKAKDAMNDLVTAYIDQAYNLENVTEENKEWTVALLKNIGVTNAEAVVESRLNKVNKQLLAGEKKLSDVFRDHATELADVNKGTDEYYKAIDQVAIAVNEMFKVVGEDGFEFVPNLDPTFIIQNLELIRQAATGDVEAIEQLRYAVMDDIVAHIRIEGANSAQIDSIRNSLSTQINDISNQLDPIEVGTYLDDSPFTAGLNNMIKGLVAFAKNAGMTADEINNILSTIGVDPVVDSYEAVEMSIDEAIAGGNLGHDAAIAARNAGRTTITVQLPKIRYKKAADTFKPNLVKANYSKPATQSNNGSGGSSGGGGENNLNEDTEETFDWIEVKIQRIEEEISRLDKTVNNVYDNWGNRNESLGDEIDKITERMEVHRHAAERYLQNANDVTVSNAPNKEDYGDNSKQFEYDLKQYNAAVKAWKTGEYQKKVREGLIGDGDIEKIQNKYLVEAINLYKELYQKHVDAKDAMQQDAIDIGDGYQKAFDNIKTQFDELISEFTHGFEIIDEQINRIEAHGYFVSKKYYQDQKQLVSKQLTEQKKHYNDLVNARDKAVEAGALEQYSEAWYNMTSDINSVENEVNSLATQLVTLDKNIRQLSWDGFDWAIDRLGVVTDEAEFLIDLLDQHDIITDLGRFNERGWASVGLHAIEYDTYMAKAVQYAQQIRAIEEQMAKDPYDKELIARREELLGLQQESIKAAEAEKEAVRDLVEQAINKHLEALQELIDKYKESLSEAKELYTYSKNINQQTENIANLEKQLQAYAGDDSEETRATIQNLQKSLEAAKESLMETEWDKYISETEKILDDMYEDYSDTLNTRLDDIDQLMRDMIAESNARQTEIQAIIHDVAEQYGYEVTNETNAILDSKDAMTSFFEKDFEDYKNGTLNALWSIYSTMLKIASGEAVRDSVRAEGGIPMWSSAGVVGYVTGSSGISHNQVAWTQENGSELIFRKSDGAMLTPLSRGDMVFTNDMSKTLWDIAKNPTLFRGTNIPGGASARTVNNDNNITLVLPNVTNYEEFKVALTKDPRFINFVQATTIGQALGKGKLNRGNY